MRQTFRQTGVDSCVGSRMSCSLRRIPGTESECRSPRFRPAHLRPYSNALGRKRIAACESPPRVTDGFALCWPSRPFRPRDSVPPDGGIFRFRRGRANRPIGIEEMESPSRIDSTAAQSTPLCGTPFGEWAGNSPAPISGNASRKLTLGAHREILSAHEFGAIIVKLCEIVLQLGPVEKLKPARQE